MTSNIEGTTPRSIVTIYRTWSGRARIAVGCLAIILSTAALILSALDRPNWGESAKYWAISGYAVSLIIVPILIALDVVVAGLTTIYAQRAAKLARWNLILETVALDLALAAIIGSCVLLMLVFT